MKINSRALLKNLFLTLMIIISLIFIFITNKIGSQGIGTRPLIIPITIAINILLFQRINQHKNNKIAKIILAILTILNLTWLIYHLYQILQYYLLYHTLELDSTYLYSITIFTIWITSMPDIKEETNNLNDILIIITSIIILAIHYRYYIDKGLIHNTIGNSDNFDVLQNRYTFITQYYPYFIVMYLTLLLHKNIINLKIEK